jgi:hypothetical protein
VRIALCIPTRERPDRLKRCLETALGTAKRPDDIEVFAAIEGDDPRRQDYEELVGHFDMHLFAGPLGSSVAGWNTCVEAAMSFESIDVYHMTADDLEFHEGWDHHVREVFDCVEGPAILHYRDDYRDQARACNPFVNRAYAEQFGFLPPELKHFHSDEWLEAMGRLSGCLLYSPSVHIRHMHPKEGRAEWDATYLNPRNPKRRNADSAEWEVLQERLRHSSARLRRIVQPQLRLVSSTCESSQQSSPSPSASTPAPA